MFHIFCILMYKEFDDRTRYIAEKLLAIGADINYTTVGGHILRELVQRYHKFPKSLTAEKLEFMFENGLDIKSTFHFTSAYVPNIVSLEYMFTNGIPIDEYIEMLQIIKKYSS